MHRALRRVDAPAVALARHAVDRAGMAPLDAAALALRLQHADDVERGVVAEELAEFLLVPADAVAVDQRDEVARRVARERRAAEVRVRGEVVRRAGADVGEVAAAAAGDADLLADRVVVLDQQHAASALPGRRRAHHAGGAGADDDDVEVSDHRRLSALRPAASLHRIAIAYRVSAAAGIAPSRPSIPMLRMGPLAGRSDPATRRTL